MFVSVECGWFISSGKGRGMKLRGSGSIRGGRWHLVRYSFACRAYPAQLNGRVKVDISRIKFSIFEKTFRSWIAVIAGLKTSRSFLPILEKFIRLKTCNRMPLSGLARSEWSVSLIRRYGPSTHRVRSCVPAPKGI